MLQTPDALRAISKGNCSSGGVKGELDLEAIRKLQPQ